MVRQLRRFEWMTLQQLDMPRYELERLLLQLALISPSIHVVDSLFAGVASVLAQVILRVSYIDSERTQMALHQWAEGQFQSVELRMELIACTVLNGLSLEQLWSMPPEEWYLHVHAGIHAATLSGIPTAEYLQGGISALVEALSQSGHGRAPSAPQGGGRSGVMEEYAFHWRKGSEPVIRGGVR